MFAIWVALSALPAILGRWPMTSNSRTASATRYTASSLDREAMFGGLAFLINGNMAVSASGQGGLLLRVDPEATEALIRNPHAERAVMRGRAMDGWLRIDARALVSDGEFQRWVNQGVNYARSLPQKSASAQREGVGLSGDG